MCVAVFPPVVHFFFLKLLCFFFLSKPRERFLIQPPTPPSRGFRICFMTVDFTPGGLSLKKTRGTGYLARTSYGFPGASGKWELLQSWRSPSFLSPALQVGGGAGAAGLWPAAVGRAALRRPRLSRARHRSPDNLETSMNPSCFGLVWRTDRLSAVLLWK